MAEDHEESRPFAPDSETVAATDRDGRGVDRDATDDFVATLDARVDRILRAFEEKLRYDASKQQVIDRQHDELVGHRGDLVAQAARPFIYGLIHHHAEIGKLLAAVRDEPAAEMSSA